MKNTKIIVWNAERKKSGVYGKSIERDLNLLKPSGNFTYLQV
jgi:hypothetical protein